MSQFKWRECALIYHLMAWVEAFVSAICELWIVLGSPQWDLSAALDKNRSNSRKSKPIQPRF